MPASSSDISVYVSAALMLSFLALAVRVDSRFNPLDRPSAYTTARTKNWLLLGLLYIAFYTGRYNVSILNTPEVRAIMGASKTEYGLSLSLGHFTYGIFMLINGAIADRVGGKKAILMGAVGSATINSLSAIMFYSRVQTIFSFTCFNILNMMFQPMGSLCVVKINTNWYTKRERGVFGGVFGVTIGLGTFTALVGGGAVISFFPFWAVFVKPAIFLLVAALIVHTFVHETPMDHLSQSPPGGDPSERTAAIGPPQPPPNSKPKDPIFVTTKRVLKLPAIRLLIVCISCVGWIREGLLSWFTSYLEEVHQVPVGSALFTVCGTGITLGGMIGSLAGGFVSDYFFDSKRMKVVLIYFVIEMMAILTFSQVENVYVACACIFVIASCLFGSLTLIIASAGADYAGHRDSGMAAGVLNFSQYMWSGLSSFGIGAAVQQGGWDLWGWVLLPAAIIGACSAGILHFGDYKTKDDGEGGGASGVVELVAVEDEMQDEKVI
jgi:OPA family glycerol-3-phosphate transporter-like MFS transporter